MKKILFICIHNSARSQIAEEYLRRMGGDEYQVESAGFEPGAINPVAAEVLHEEGIDISGKQTRSVFDLFRQGRTYDYVITVCDESGEGKCPIFPGMTHRLHIPFQDFSTLEGTHEEKLAQGRVIRNAIKNMIRDFLEWDRSRGEHRLGDDWAVISAGLRKQA